ncbi:MAG: nitroreductase family protein [Gemmataceae bacterium]
MVLQQPPGEGKLTEPAFIPYRSERLGNSEMTRRAATFYELMDARRSVRHFSSDPVPRELIELAIRTASTAPSGAHRQPWRFVAIDDPALKHEIRLAAEEEERLSYEGRMPAEWLDALAPLGTNWRKPYLEIVPWLVVVFEEQHGLGADGQVRKNYYVKESVGIACGLFIAALHNMGLATLTHTPSPMGFLSKILKRPENEKPYILFPVGHPAPDAEVPNITRKPLDEVAVFPLCDTQGYNSEDPEGPSN